MAEIPTKLHKQGSSMLEATGETPAAVKDEQPLAAVAYILTWLTGLIIFLVAKKEQHYARWNAVQAIGLGIAAVVVSIAASILGALLGFAGGFAGSLVAGALSLLVWLAVIAAVVLCAVKAYQGTPLRLPVVAGFADKYA